MNNKIIFFPWDDEAKRPFWVNPENGIEWWIDENTTNYANLERENLPSLNATCFFCREGWCSPVPLSCF